MRRATSLALATCLCIPLHSVVAQGWVEIENRTPETPTGPVTRVDSRVTISLDDRLAHVQVEERFRNEGPAIAEGSYLYPLAGEASFNDFSLWLNGEELRGEPMDAEKAREIYESIVRRKKDPALLTLAGHGLVRAQIFPFQPGETRRVALRYTQLMVRQGDALRLRYALGVRGGDSPTELRIEVTRGELYGPPYSPTHTIDNRTEGGRLVITVAPGSTGDVELLLPLRRPVAGATLLTHAPAGEHGYFMLLLAPGSARSDRSVPRDLTLVVDVSGSMSGTKLKQAKAALQHALGTLGPDDRFRIVAFSGTVRRFGEQPVGATAANLADAREFVEGLDAEGGTNIAGALDAALDGSSGTERLSQIILLSDGMPSVGEQAPDRIAGQAAARIGRARIFPVGIGHDVNAYLLDRLAVEGRGTVEYVPPGASVESAMGAVLGKLRHPALVDLRIAESPVELVDMQPAQLPDLFHGAELVVFGRYRDAGAGRLVVTGTRDGVRERVEARADFARSGQDNAFIPRLWAARRIGDLTRTIRVEGASPVLLEEIRDLGLRFGILTEYTSYLVQEPGVMAERPVPMPRLEAAGSQTGAAAFDRARRSAKFVETTNLQAADELAAGSPDGPLPASGPTTRRAGDRLFVLRGAVWTDVGHPDRIPVTAVAAYSRAYFELVRMLPELAPYLSAGEDIVVAGRRRSIRIAHRGTEVWRPGELAELIRNFRGT
ncbi:MAG TPA: VIT domain-containing protein [Gemmatimonadales bacterium]|nr:VIT domain-containing protein [Gemmatimonadales bacterium]